MSAGLYNCDRGYPVLLCKNLIHQLPQMMQVFIADLDEDASPRSQQLAGEQEPVAHVGQVGVQA